MNWMDKAACKSLPTDVFFEPERDDFDSYTEYGNAREASFKVARKICAGCPVAKACLNENLLQRFGVWGGKTPRQRQELQWKLKLNRRGGNTHMEGEPRGHDDFTLSEVLRLFEKGHSYRDIESLTGVQTGVIYRLVRQGKTQEQKLADAQARQENFNSARGAFRLEPMQDWRNPRFTEARKLLIEGTLQKKQIVQKTGIPKTTLRRLELGMRVAGALK
jgi:hypothetical protein